MADPFKLTRIPSLKSVADFRRHVGSLGISLFCEEDIVAGATSPLAMPVSDVRIHGKCIGNRLALHPMEGWDATATGGVTDEVRRRWRRFGQSGAKLICGAEAMAVCPSGRANPNQLIISRSNEGALAELLEILTSSHREHHGTSDDLVVGFQLTHSGRFCRPNDKARGEPRVAFRHPILDRKFQVTSAAQVFTDEDVAHLVQDYVQAAALARDVGADFVDLKHCHGYLLHEFLAAHTRGGCYGGSFENRTRILREIVAGIRATGNGIDLGVRLSLFDLVPFRPDPALTVPGKLGPGIPEPYLEHLPYLYGFGVSPEDPTRIDLSETFQFVELCATLGVKILNTTAGSPYYNPHIQRPAAYPPGDGYQSPTDPLMDVYRQVDAVRRVKAHLATNLSPAGSAPAPLVVSSGLSYLQEYLPHVAQYLVRQGWTDLVGVGRAVLSYPTMLSDAIQKGALQARSICRTFSDCTTAPRNGLVSGCYPLDSHYTGRPEYQKLKAIKKHISG